MPRPTLAELYTEFLVRVEDFPDIPICGLCGNHGVIRANWIMTRSGDNNEVEAYCICPNGRRRRRRELGTKWGNPRLNGESVIKSGHKDLPTAKKPRGSGRGKKSLWTHLLKD